MNVRPGLRKSCKSYHRVATRSGGRSSNPSFVQRPAQQPRHHAVIAIRHQAFSILRVTKARHGLMSISVGSSNGWWNQVCTCSIEQSYRGRRSPAAGRSRMTPTTTCAGPACSSNETVDPGWIAKGRVPSCPYLPLPSPCAVYVSLL